MLVHTSERADVLVDALADLLAADPSPDPFTPEVVAVPTRGVERWVAQRLSHRLGALGDPLGGASRGGEAGVCANVTFDPPARVVHRAVAAASGIDPDDDPWQPERLAWWVLRTTDAAIDAGEPWAAPLARYLVDAPDGPGARDEVRAGRRMRFAQTVAGRFAAYASQRPSLVTAWARGRDDDGLGATLPPDLAWQPALWRAVRESVGVPGPAERLAAATQALRDDPALSDLPRRLSVFGPTRLPEAHLAVLDALAQHRDVHLWVPHPSPVLWRRVETASGAAASGGAASGAMRAGTGAPRRADVPAVAAHPLLASLARDATELGLRLLAHGVAVEHHAAPAPPATVLGTLQAALRADVRTAPGARPLARTGDRTVQVHSCHGRARQVEVLREVVVGLLADDPTLEPRDVAVLCPDVEAFAPLVVATFGAPWETPGDVASASGAPHPGRTLRVRVADRSPARTNPLLRVVSDLLELAGSRVTASAVVDLAGLDAVRRRFGFDDDDLERLRTWAFEAGVRWGEDGSRRARYGLGRVGQGTWRTATDRLLLGVAMADEDDRFLGATVPLDDLGSSSDDVDLAGRFAELVDRLTGLLGELDGSRAASAWFDALDRALVLLTDVAPADQWQRVEARAVLADARASAGGAGVPAAGPGAGTLLRLSDVVALLAPRLAGRPTRAGFRTGALTVCSLEPMRAVPHRVVCLLGMDDTAFPRAGSPSGDDVLARDPLVGERDRRAEDRQLFLDAVTSATEHLVVVHSGADERTGRVLPPAVPVGELLDAVDEAVAWTGPDGSPRSAREALVVHHPLQPVDERNFTAGALGRPGPFSFDAVERRAAVVGRGERVGPSPLLAAPLAPEPDLDGTLDLDALVEALEHPSRTFVRRLGVVLPRDADELEDRLPLAVEPLDAWASGDRLLRARLSGADPGRSLAAERRRAGYLPPGRLGGAALDDVAACVDAVADAVRPFVGDAPQTVDVTVVLPDGRTLAGTVPGVRGALLVRAEYSRLGPKHRLRAWVQLLALAASDGVPASRGAAPRPGGDPAAGTGWRAVTAGRGPGRRSSAAVRGLTAPPRGEALRVLGTLAALHDVARREPLPVPVDPAESYAQQRSGRVAPEPALDQAQAALDRARHEDDYDVFTWGSRFLLGRIGGAPTPAEHALAPDEPTRFGALARIVWDPLLARETGDLA